MTRTARSQALRRGRRLGPAGLLLLAGAAGQPTTQQIDAAERARAAELAAGQQAANRLHAAQAEANRLATARVAATATLRTLENATADAAERTETLARRRAEAADRLAARAADLEPLLPLTVRLSLYPAETLLAVPGPPQDALRGLLVLKGLSRALEADAEAMRAEQAEVARLTAETAVQDKRLSEAQAAQAAQAAALDAQIAAAQARGRDAEDDASIAARRAAEQARTADSLRAALAELEAARRQDEARARAEAAQAAQAAQRHRQDLAAANEAKRREVALTAPAGPGLAEPHGQLGAPVAGAIVHAFGEAGDAGPATGVSYGAPPGARVSAPCAGRVAFAGPFRSYGQLIILDCGGGYHFVLAGLDRLDVPVGRPVQAGEPLGAMPGWDPHAGGNHPTLYVELRDHGQAVNPAPFLRGRS